MKFKMSSNQALVGFSSYLELRKLFNNLPLTAYERALINVGHSNHVVTHFYLVNGFIKLLFLRIGL